MPQLVHPDWENYPEISWSANWHKLFQDDPNDGRRDLGWPGRFANVVPSIVNFYSSGDEVLELAADNDISILTGATSGYRQYAWHRQELWKGRALANVLGGTTWSGWNIEEYLKGIRKISVDKANQMSTADFKTNTVFYCYPPNMKSPEITKNECNAHLAMGIPALTPAMGLTGNLSVLDSESIINLEDGARLPNGIPTRTSYPNRWLHSDVYTLPYFYSHKLFEEILQKGNLR